LAVEILHDPIEQFAVYICNTTDTAFGPIFRGQEARDDAEAFSIWISRGAGTVAGRHLGCQPLGIRDGRDLRDWSTDALRVLHDEWNGYRRPAREFRCVVDESAGLRAVESE
jgi:hypothetical protein